MRRTLVFPFLAAAMLAATFWCTPVSAQYHEDNDWGFKIKVPRAWREIPLKAQERWIIGRYQSNKSYVSEESVPSKPEMKIVVFPESAKKQKSKVDAKAKESEGTIRVTWKARYKNYKDYLKGNYVGGGYYFSEEKEQELAGIRVDQYQIKVEKATRMGKQRIITWVYHLPSADVAVEFTVLEVRYRKLKGMCYGALKSFKLAEATGSAEQKEAAPVLERPTREKWEKMSPIARMKFQKDRSDRIIKAAIANLPDGWKHKKSPHFEVFTHVDARFTKQVVNQAEAIRAWLDKTFYEIGDEYVPRVIIRVCIDLDEARAYVLGSSDAFSLDTRELVVAKRTTMGRRMQMEWMSNGICRQWFYDKNDVLAQYLPRWVSAGMTQYVSTALVKGKKLQFKPDDWERDGIRKADRDGKLVGTRDLVKMTDKQYVQSSNSSGGATRIQAGSLIRHLMSPRSRKNKLTKDIMIAYLRNLNDVAKEIEAKDKKKGKRTRAKTAKEEREMRKKNREQNEKQARFVVDETFKRTFGHWTEEDWGKFERGWRKAAL